VSERIESLMERVASMHLGVWSWSGQSPELQTECQNGKERWFWAWHGCWCQTGRSEYFM